MAPNTLTVAIIGSRDFPPSGEATVRMIVQKVLKIATEAGKELVIVSGGADGPDTWAADEARHLGITTIVIKPDWDANPKTAGFIRNTTIVDMADAVFALWNGKSNGTRDSIGKARRRNKKLRVIYPDSFATRSKA